MGPDEGAGRWSTAAAAAFDLLLPSACVGCGRPGAGLRPALCAACRRVVLGQQPAVVPVAPGCPAFAAARYEGVVRDALLAYKERGARGLGRMLGECVAAGCLAAGERGQLSWPTVLVPVPSRRDARRQRGFEPVDALAGIVAARLSRSGLPTTTVRALHHRRMVADQSGLDADERARNMAGALGVRRVDRVAGRVVAVVDDIVTTGATAREAARALTAAGAVVGCVVAVAATPRRP